MDNKRPDLKERTLIILKPDTLQRGILGKIIERFENKGLKIVGIKMVQLKDVLLNEHYHHHKDKPFFKTLKNFMKSAPVVIMVLEGLEAVRVSRLLAGPTMGRDASPGTIRGDFSMSTQANIIHASESLVIARQEIKRFFVPKELYFYQKVDMHFIYGEEEIKKEKKIKYPSR